MTSREAPSSPYFSAIITFLYTAVTAPDFTFTSLNLDQMTTVAFIAFIGYLAKNFVSTDDGKVLGPV